MDTEFQAHEKCAHCGAVKYQGDMLAVERYIGGEKKTMKFCGELCANEYFLEALRVAGI